MLDSYYLKELHDEQKAMHEFNKGWKLSGIQRIFYNTLVSELGGFGSEPGRFIWPTSVTTMLSGDLVVKDAGNKQIQIFCPNGHYKQGFSYGSESVDIFGDVACTHEDLLLVTDGSQAIKVFSKEGEMIYLIKSSKTDWRHSYGMAVLNSNSIAVTDWSDEGKIHIIGVDWRMHAIFKMNVIEGLHRPEYIAANKNEDILVTEGQLIHQHKGCSLKIIDNEKIVKKVIRPKYGNAFCFVNPSGVSVDPDGNIFVADKGQNCTIMFNPDFSLMELVVTHDLEGPGGLAVTRNGFLAVADCYHHNVKLYKYRQE